MRREEAGQLLAGVAAAGDAVADVGAVEAGDEHARVVETETLADLDAGGFVGGRGERDARYVRESLAELPEAEVLGSEVVPPA